MNFWQSSIGKLKNILFVSLIVSILSYFVFPALNISASGPRFNFLEGDHELIRGLNQTKGESVYKNPVDGEIGDKFKAIIYYHNGIVDSVAENTRIKINLPSETTGSQLKITATISADNTETVSSTIVDGQIVGRDSLITRLDNDSLVKLVPGSVRWIPDAESNSETVQLPGGQTGDEISGPGINIGNIQGCWQFAGYVTFEYVTILKTIDFNLNKEVRNVSAGENDFTKETSVRINDLVEYKISFSNVSDSVINGVKFKDFLPSGVEYVPGSLKQVIGNTTLVLSDESANQLFGEGFEVSVNGKENFTLIFCTKVCLAISERVELINKVRVEACDKTKESIAKAIGIPEIGPKIIKSKTAKNLRSQKIGVSLQSIPGDEILYTLATKNEGDVAVNFQVQDGVADILEYAEIIDISDNGDLTNGTTGNYEKIIQYPPQMIQPGQTIINTFVIKINNPLPNQPQDGFSYDYVLFNNYGNDVCVNLERPIPKNPELKLEKLVRNFTAGENDFSPKNEAIAGDQLEYIINFQNVGDEPADYVSFSDVLPANTQYIPGTTTISINGFGDHTIYDGITEEGIKLDSIQPGDDGYIKFRVVTDPSLAEGEKLVNTATLAFKGSSLTSSAMTLIHQKPQIQIPTETPEIQFPQQQFEFLPMLPITGWGSGILTFLLTFALGVLFIYSKYKKELLALQSI